MSEATAHAAPGTGLHYLPLTGIKDVDRPSGKGASNGVPSLDSRIGTMNTGTINVDPERIRSYCDTSCGQGCVDSLTTMPSMDATPLSAVFDGLNEQIAAVQSVVSNELSGTWQERLSEKYGRNGEVDLPMLTEHTDAVKAALPAVITSSNKHTFDAHRTVRATVKSLRTYLAESEKANKGGFKNFWEEVQAHSNPASWLRFLFEGKGDNDDTRVAPSIADLNANAAEHDKKITALDVTLADWKLSGTADTTGNQLSGNAGVGSDVSEAPDEVITDPGGGDTDTPDTSLADKLDELLGREPEARPDMGLGDGLGGGMPGGGMPGGMGMPDLGQGMGNPFGQEQPFAALADEPLDDEPLPAETEEAADDGDTDKGEGDAADVDEAPDDELLPDDTQPDDGGVAPIDAGVPAAHAEFDPNSEEARTVDVGNGRTAVMPSFRMAETLRAMVAADQFNPKSLYMAASESGYVLPPQGEDIGTPVEPASMKVGDVISADGKHGVYLGDGDVFMEGGTTEKLGDVADRMNGEHQGLFRLTEPTEGMDAHGPVQQVGAVQETPHVAAVPVEVGVPTDDAPVVGSTNESTAQMPGLSMSAAALDPNAAFSS